MDPQDELDNLYEFIGGGGEFTDELMERIHELEDIINPPVVYKEPEREIVYCSPTCNGIQCWDCAALQGGDPMDS